MSQCLFYYLLKGISLFPEREVSQWVRTFTTKISGPEFKFPHNSLAWHSVPVIPMVVGETRRAGEVSVPLGVCFL